MAANEQQRKEPRDLREPAHHARRPMNAFLIFCKRHRGSVRSGFPHLENRAVTRVLGEWWATLSPDQKKSYTKLAQEYKDAFLNANPDFKWYKLPAPPLRTLTTRPTNKKPETSTQDHHHHHHHHHHHYHQDDTKESLDSSSSRTSAQRTDGQSIQPGKLADESQIGGLSSLFTPQKVQAVQDDDEDEDETLVNGDQTDVDAVVPKPPKKRYVDLPVLSADTKKECKADLFDAKKRKRPESNNNEHQPDCDDERVDEVNEVNRYLSTSTHLEESGYRGERTCKGLRYQKFLAEQMKNVGSSGQTQKRRRGGYRSGDGQTSERRNSISSNVSEKTDSLSSEGTGSSRSELEHLVESAEGNIEASKPEETETEGAEGQLDYGPWTARKRFRAEDFNLEKKIEALPSLSLEEFQEKKKQQRTKKKKIAQKAATSAASAGSSSSSSSSVSGRRQNQNQNGGPCKRSHLQNERETSEESDRSALVGSQKRKARKQSITRNAAAMSSGNAGQSEDRAPDKSWCASPDLEALACLATVAANRTKLTKNN